MPIKLDEYDGVGVISIEGDFSGDAVTGARKSAEGLIGQKQCRDFVVDFEKSSFVDSEGLESLIWLRRRCEDQFGQFKLAGTDENVRRILDLTRLSKRFDQATDVAAALKAMR